ncbi:MAG: hypothetical protein ABEI07_01520, partial [Candidatus Nanohaloarchaea archaeon]
RVTERLLFEMNSPRKLLKTFLIDVVQNRDLFARAPSQITKALESPNTGGETNIEVDSGPSKKTVLAAVLILSSSAFLLQSLPREQMLAVGAVEILIAIYLLFR